VVATPIGNLGDITQRAVETLRGVDLIAAEDTRRTRGLLQHLGIATALISLHDHNEEQRVPGLLAKLARGLSVALVSDAGTPLISDPGYRLIRRAGDSGYRIVPIPGACSPIAALCAAGLPTDRFVFEGFPPSRAGARRHYLHELRTTTATLVFFESGARLPESLLDMSAILGGGRAAVVAKELTKLHEHFERGDLGELQRWAAQDPNVRRGEFVVMVAGAADEPVGAADPDALRVLRILLKELPAGRAAALAARITGARRGDLYRAALAMAGADR
jgi:16S rRNA (cytidine1402-2'-O)-methyltransferase